MVLTFSECPYKWGYWSISFWNKARRNLSPDRKKDLAYLSSHLTPHMILWNVSQQFSPSTGQMLSDGLWTLWTSPYPSQTAYPPNHSMKRVGFLALSMPNGPHRFAQLLALLWTCYGWSCGSHSTESLWSYHWTVNPLCCRALSSFQYALHPQPTALSQYLTPRMLVWTNQLWLKWLTLHLSELHRNS